MPDPTAVVSPDLLRIYCQDHVAAAGGGVALVQRMLAQRSGGPGWQDRLTGLLTELHEEQDAWQRAVEALGFGRNRVKEVAVVVGEWLSRFKPDGNLTGRTALSEVVEYEFLMAAVLAKRAGFETLLGLADVDGRLDRDQLVALVDQADSQHDWLADARRDVAARAFGGSPETPDAVADS